VSNRLIPLVALMAALPIAAHAAISWRFALKVCNIAGSVHCNAWMAGSFETLKNLHQICPDSPLNAAEVWKMTEAHFAGDPDRQVDGSLSGLVMEAAKAKYPCPPRKP
jgi:hypothetical protein